MNPNKELLKGTLSTIILRLLSEHDRMYGYELAHHVKELTAGKILIKEGSLYPALHKLEADGHVVVESVNMGKRVRRYYRLTPKGQKSAKVAVNELLDFLTTIEQLITTSPNYGTA